MKSGGKDYRSLPFLLLLIIIIAAAGWGVFRFRSIPDVPVENSPEPILEFDPKILTVAVDSRPAGMLFYAVNHYLPRNRFQLKPVVIEDPGQRWLCLASGKVDMAFSTLPEYVLGATRHNPGVLIGFTSMSRGADGVIIRKPISDIRELSGKKISCVPGSAGHFLLIQLLNSRGMSTSEVDLAPAPFNVNAYEYFTGDLSVDSAAISGEPFFKGSVLYHPAASTSDSAPIAEAVIAGRLAVKNRPQDIQLFLNCYYQLVDFIRINRGLAKKLISTRSGRSVDEVEKMLSSTELKTLDEARKPTRDEVVDEMKKMQQIWAIEGLPNADGRVDMESAVNFTFLEKAVVKPADPLFDPTSEPPASPSPEVTPEIPEF